MAPACDRRTDGRTGRRVVQPQGWVSSGKKLFLPDMRFKPVNSGKNQNAGIMGWYE